MQNNILVERKTYEKNGKEYFSYFIKGVIRGREVQIAVVPPDRGGYAVLDIVFDGQMSADLVVKPFEFKDDATGKIISGNSFVVTSVDEDGVVYECAVKPFRSSDKSLLNMLINVA